MTERERKIIRILEIYRGNYYRDSIDERCSEQLREVSRVIGHAFDEAISRIKKELEDESNCHLEGRSDREAGEMKKAKKEVLGPLAKEAYGFKRAKDIKAKVALGPPEKPPKTAAAAKRSRSEAAKAAWANHRDKITRGINNFYARKRLATGNSKPKAKVKVPPQVQAQA